MPQAFAGAVRVDAAGPSCVVRFTAGFDSNSLVFERHRNFDIVRLPEAGFLNEPGLPKLPVAALRIALPAGMAVTGAKATGVTAVDLPGSYAIAPAQPVQRISDPPGAFVPPDANAYSSTEPYPVNLIRSVRQNDLAGQSMAIVEVCPVQYIPATGQLLLNTAIEITIEGTAGYVCGDYLSPAISAPEQAARALEVGEMVLNPEDVQLAAPLLLDGGSRALSPEYYPYVIITAEEWVSAFQPLADWKTKKGVPARIVTTAWIYNSGEYSGNNQAKIRSFVQEAYTNWGTRYFLLGGDTNVIPTGMRHVIDDDIPNDTYYADFDSDWICEAHVGRAPVRTSSDVTVFVNKTLVYQKTPPANFGNWAALFGFDLHHEGSAEGEDCKQMIRTQYLSDSWTCHREYDSQAGGHLADTINFLNQGHNLTNHIDHSSTYSMGAGSTNHGTYLTPSTMANLTNGARQGILYSIGCWACDFDSETCIAEAFVRNPGGGGVAFIGNSRFGWYVPGSPDAASGHFDRLFFRSLFDQNHYILGDCFSDHKNDAFDGDSHSQYIFTELTLLGDPELPLWTADPAPLSVVHPASIPLDAFTSFTTHVTSGGNPVADATVCLWKAGDVYEIAQTDSSGNASFWFFASDLGNLQVTVTKRNYIPYEGQSPVIPSSGPYALFVLVHGAGEVVVLPGGEAYAPGTSVELDAQPAPGWCFDHWEYALGGTTTPTTVVMDGNKIVVAVFAPDCNANNRDDAVDIATGFSSDCNENSVPDECDLTAGGSEDCNENMIPDECELAPPTFVEPADNCADALIVCPGRTYWGTTLGATPDGASSCGSAGDSPDVWYYFRPSGSGFLTLSLCGSSFDTVVSVHSGCPGTTANQIVCNDNSCGLQSEVSLYVQNLRSYWIRVSGAGTAAGDFQFSMAGPACFYDDTDLDHDGVLDECQIVCGAMGDANCDGAVNVFDIDPFVLALTSPAQWSATYACHILCANDCNGDGEVNVFDIDPFVAALTGEN